MELSSPPLTFYDFLDRMRHPASVDLVRSIKSFIVSFSFQAANSENDSRRLQDFLLAMETTIRDHPLWAGASEEDIDNAVEGLEKYVMTKLFNRTFASSPEDVKTDQEISEKIRLLQHFVRPEHLDIPGVFQNEASWLIAEKELQKINAFKAPREKLLCILNCCRVVNNLLLNVSMSTNHVPAGADDFLPVLIYVTIKANPPQFHSNLKYIQLFRQQSKLISESAYYLTNLVSVESFIIGLDANSLSIGENEFQESMREARLAEAAQAGPSAKLVLPVDLGPALRRHDKDARGKYPYMEAEAGELTVEDVHKLLSLYKDVVTRYSMLCKAVKGVSLDNETSSLVLNQDLSNCTPSQSKSDELGSAASEAEVAGSTVAQHENAG
ncbi:vacuolar protein sorting-associated protein 9A-like [Tasmannia lanceolata]|uniref:vacuolar protein sorting-associated protein 9A-like n=1 Tax=Tasmannia lanceolata TaxID=3420 RepID=UPI0040648ADD